MKMLFLFALCLVGFAAAKDVSFASLVGNGAVIDTGISVEYSTSNTSGFVPYASCQGGEDCVDLNWDDDAKMKITINFPTKEEIGAVSISNIDGLEIQAPIKYSLYACFETEYTKGRKWRKPKPIIQDDKRCSKKIFGKTALPGEAITRTYTIPSDFPGATYFLTLFIFCDSSDGDQYCALDTTGAIANLAKPDAVQSVLGGNNDGDATTAFIDGLAKSNEFSFRTSVIDSRPTSLIVCVVVFSVLSVSMLVLYFIYERALKKTN